MSWSLADSEGTAPLRVSQFLEIVKGLLASVPFAYKPTNPEPVPQLLPSWSFDIRTTILPPTHPKARNQTTRDSSQAHGPPRLFRQKPVCLPWLFPPTGTTTKAPAHILPGSLCLLTSPGAPRWAALPLRTGSSRNCLFNGSCLLICWAHQTSIEIKSAF